MHCGQALILSAHREVQVERLERADWDGESRGHDSVHREGKFSFEKHVKQFTSIESKFHLL